METLKIISLLLSYPEAELLAHRDDMVNVINNADLSIKNKSRLLATLGQLVKMDLLDAQEAYINTFDRGRACSLLMFEHVHGQSRDRGQAMIDLLTVYEQYGFELNTRELPDYLPLFLEFLSIAEGVDAAHWLKELAAILELIEERLRKRESIYTPLFTVLLDLAQHDRDVLLEQKIAQEKRDDTPEQIDAVWEEEIVRFMDAQQQGCMTQKPLPSQQVVDAVRLQMN